MDPRRHRNAQFRRDCGACNNGTAIPSGWVITQFSTNNTTCGSGTNNVASLLNLNGMPNSSTAAVCATSPIPTNWVITNTSTNNTKCGSGLNNVFSLLLVSGDPSGTQHTVCENSPVPTGWSIISTGTSLTTCGDFTGDIETIKRS